MDVLVYWEAIIGILIFIMIYTQVYPNLFKDYHSERKTPLIKSGKPILIYKGELWYVDSWRPLDKDMTQLTIRGFFHNAWRKIDVRKGSIRPTDPEQAAFGEGAGVYGLVEDVSTEYETLYNEYKSLENRFKKLQNDFITLQEEKRLLEVNFESKVQQAIEKQIEFQRAAAKREMYPIKK